MGADLYRNDILDPIREQTKKTFDEAVAVRDALPPNDPRLDAAQADVDAAYDAMYPDGAYFRDSYNCSSVLNRLGLSWWQDVIPMLDKEGNLSPDRCKELADQIDNIDLQPISDSDWQDNWQSHTRDTRESWDKYFLEKKQRLIDFLRSAAEAGQPISCSL